MLRWISRIFITVILILIMGSLGLIYVISREVVAPDTSDIDLGQISNVDIRQSAELKQKKHHLLVQKKLALEEQAQLLEKNKLLLEKRKQEIDAYIYEDLKNIRDRYQREINDYQETLDRNYLEF